MGNAIRRLVRAALEVAKLERTMTRGLQSESQSGKTPIKRRKNTQAVGDK